jgi:hypothetical protein
MNVELDSHQPDFHPGIPSFRDKYKRIGEKIVNATYAVVFVPGRQRYITGGIAAQFYMPPDARRGSDDIDVSDIERRAWGQFKQAMGEDLAVVAQSTDSFEGYQIALYQRNHSFVLHVCNWFTEEKKKRHYFNAEFPSYSQGHYDNLRPTLEREAASAQTFEVGNQKILVLDPVDIIARKIVRLVNYHEHEGFDIDESLPGSLSEHLRLIDSQRDFLETVSKRVRKGKESPASYQLERTHLRFLCDQYDIKALFKWAEFDENYFNDVIFNLIERGYDSEHVDWLVRLLYPSQNG